MDSQKSKQTIIILVILVVCAVIMRAFATGHAVEKSGSNTAQTAASAQTSQTPEDLQQPQDSAQPTDTPGQPDRPSPITPEPERPRPRRPPARYPAPAAASNTGAPLNLVVDWAPKALCPDGIQVTFEMYLNCYTINATPNRAGDHNRERPDLPPPALPAPQAPSATPTTVRLCTKTVTMSLAAGESRACRCRPRGPSAASTAMWISPPSTLPAP